MKALDSHMKRVALARNKQLGRHLIKEQPTANRRGYNSCGYCGKLFKRGSRLRTMCMFCVLPHQEKKMALDLEAIELQWAPLAGNDTNGPHTATANTIMDLVAKIKSLRNDLEISVKFAQDQVDAVASLNTEIDRLRDVASATEDAKVTKLAKTVEVGEAVTPTGKETSSKL